MLVYIVMTTYDDEQDFSLIGFFDRSLASDHLRYIVEEQGVNIEIEDQPVGTSVYVDDDVDGEFVSKVVCSEWGTCEIRSVEIVE